jgi:glycosyltransferase involved in cell wall biosynthesis
MINIEILGKFFDNHSLSIINRQIALNLNKVEDFNIFLTPLDELTNDFKVNKNNIKTIKTLSEKECDDVHIQIRHSYPPIWNWPTNKETKVIYIQPWEFPKVPFEWQYRFETFADTLCVPSNYEKDIFITGGMNPDNIAVVPNGYDDKIFNLDPVDPYPGIDPDNYNFVFVGNGQWRKGVDILLNAWKDAVKRFDKAVLIIKDNPAVYGMNNLLNEVIKLQYKTQCGNIIYIDDQLSDLEMASIYKNCWGIIHPYRAEGFGMHIQEAVACGCFPFLPNAGPHDDFIPVEIGARFDISTKAINITDPEYFALKPGDATSLMSTHTFINEPIQENVRQIIQGVYHHHQKENLQKAVRDVKMENTWTNVCKKYEEVIRNVSERVQPQRIS